MDRSRLPTRRRRLPDDDAYVAGLLGGAYALAAHGLPRATGDIDLWVRPTAENAERVLRALHAFGAPSRDLARDDLCRPDTVFEIGVAPSRIDILTGLTFAVAPEEPPAAG